MTAYGEAGCRSVSESAGAILWSSCGGDIPPQVAHGKELQATSFLPNGGPNLELSEVRKQ